MSNAGRVDCMPIQSGRLISKLVGDSFDDRSKGKDKHIWKTARREPSWIDKAANATRARTPCVGQRKASLFQGSSGWRPRLGLHKTLVDLALGFWGSSARGNGNVPACCRKWISKSLEHLSAQSLTAIISEGSRTKHSLGRRAEPPDLLPKLQQTNRTIISIGEWTRLSKGHVRKLQLTAGLVWMGKKSGDLSGKEIKEWNSIFVAFPFPTVIFLL